MIHRMQIPRATYRLQFHKGFAFRDAMAILPYLAKLGISHIYASPVFMARPGSLHGYDILNHNCINPELGGEEDFDSVCGLALKLGLQWIQDFVPNHMAYDSDNALIMDVLEKGRSSPYADFFDIDWNPYELRLQNRILAPFLGSFYAHALDRGEIRFVWDSRGLGFSYYRQRYPLRINGYPELIRHFARECGKTNNELRRNLEILADGFESGPTPELMQDLVRMGGQAELRQLTREMNGTPGDPASLSLLDQLLRNQHFRLAFWKTAADEINYRRFFAINDLISLRCEDRAVFDTIHRLLLRKLKTGRIAGLRIDHIDGLHDPALYLRWLREQAGDRLIVVEKILAAGETLPAWPVQGTTGYDFLNALNGLFLDRSNDTAMVKAYSRLVGPLLPYRLVLADKKRLLLGRHMRGNIEQLAWMFEKIAAGSRYACDLTHPSLAQAISEIMVHFEVYRTYISPLLFSPADQKVLETAIQAARESNPDLEYEIGIVGTYLLKQPKADGSGPWQSEFIMKFQQFTGPLMAKAFEDTFLYCYNKLISMNDVGGTPMEFGLDPADFCGFLSRRQRNFPHTFNATATHDTKRGEDVRARINVLSEIPAQWERRVSRWMRINRPKKPLGQTGPIPDSNDEYFLYQTLVGALPFDAQEVPAFRARMESYVVKAVREAKVHTGWVKSHPEYEEGCVRFLRQILDGTHDNPFWPDFLEFQKRVAHFGMLNSLSQVLIKIASPGVADFYQGCELWDFSLVDPDNRRPVDFAKRERHLNGILQREATDRGTFIVDMLANMADGRAKLFVVHRGLKTRLEIPELFEVGDFLPVEACGPLAECAFAFLRRRGPLWALVVAPRLTTRLVRPGALPLGESVWRETGLRLPEETPRTWINAFTGQLLTGQHPLKVGRVLEDFPVALLTGLVR